jgi:hypothetical protein
MNAGVGKSGVAMSKVGFTKIRTLRTQEEWLLKVRGGPLLEEYNQRVLQMVRPVLEGERSGWETCIGYLNTSEYHVFLIYMISLDGYPDLHSAIFANEDDVRVVFSSKTADHAIYKYLVDNDKSLLAGFIDSKRDEHEEIWLRNIYDWIREEEEKGSLTIIDKELYDFFKLVILQYLIYSIFRSAISQVMELLTRPSVT